MPRRPALLAVSVLIVAPYLAAPGYAGAAKPELAVAAAANLTEAFGVLGAEFEKAAGIHLVVSFGSTASLTRQIENGAPWDLFAAADTEHVEQLDRKGLLVTGSRAVYATGILALWLPSLASPVNRLEDLTHPAVRVIAVAKPELAPYGLATRESLQRLGIWGAVEPKMVYAENISMAKQYGATGNADAVFTAYALLRGNDGGRVIQVPEELHRPVRQALGIVAASKKQALARQFADFLLTGRGHAILLQHGYR
jgi:molybdate transport system substrate-binding protein